MIPSQGIRARIDGKVVLAGNPKLLREQAVPFSQPQAAKNYLRQGCTVTYVAVDGIFVGLIALSDTLRAESAATISALSSLGVRPVLLTGDHENAAKTIAGRLGITDVRAIIGTLNPVVGALVHNAGSILVIANSALLLNWRLRVL